MMRRLRRRLRYWLESGERARLLREEMEAHLEMKVEELREGGMSEADARGAARRAFGNLTRQQEDSRGVWIARWLGDLAQDSVFAVRTFRNQPGFAAVAILSAALGIGACSMIFGIVNYAFLQTLPVHNADRLESISGRGLRGGRAGTSLPYPDVEDLRAARSFSGIAAYYPFMPATIATNGEPRRYWGSVVTANYFDVARPEFALGGGFDATRDDRKGGAPQVVLSYPLWRSRFGGDPGIVGRVIDLNRQRVTVAGVTGPGFRGTESMFVSDYWIPFSMLDSLGQTSMQSDRLSRRGSQWLQAVGRLREGVSEQAAVAEIDAIGKRLREMYPDTNADRGYYVERAGQLHPSVRKMAAVMFALLLGVAVLVLCTACANIANLLLARASARQREIATRIAIGAGRGRLLRQLFTESVMLAMAGGAGGFVLAYLGTRALASVQLPFSLPVNLAFALDVRVVLFSAMLAALTGMLFGFVPALVATRPDLSGALKNAQSGAGRMRRFSLRNALVVGQVAISMVLLICSGLFVRSLYSAGGTELGFTNRNIVLEGFDPSLSGYTGETARPLLDRILERVRSMPGVESAAFGNAVPLNVEGTQNGFSVEGSADRTGHIADIYAVSPRFFDTFGIRMIDGEDFREGVPGDDIVIVNEALAARAFPRQNPIGRRISYFGRSVRITGLVATTKSRTIGEDPHPSLYFPLAREARGNDSLTGVTLIVRTRGNPAGYLVPVREAIRRADPALAVFDVRTMDEQITKALLVPRVTAVLFGLAGIMGLLISTVGIYGVISFAVARQTKEIGVRMALGAQRSQVLGRVLGQGMTLVAVGALAGLGAAFALSKTAASLLYGVSPRDPLTFLAVPLLLLLIAAAACLVPARRAASLDPIRTLRYE